MHRDKEQANLVSKKLVSAKRLCLDGLNLHSVELRLSYEVQIETAEKSA
jgi:hypothetical protein